MNARKTGLNLVAIFEGAKGLLVLLTGFGILALIHEDIHRVAEELVRHFHLNPASRYPRIFLDLSDRITDGRLWFMAFAAFGYAVIRFIEAVGLWLDRRWAAWFGLLSGGLYVPIEAFELFQGITWPKVTIITVNILIVGYLAFTLFPSKNENF